MSQPLPVEWDLEVGTGPALAKPRPEATITRNHAAAMTHLRLLPPAAWLRFLTTLNGQWWLMCVMCKWICDFKRHEWVGPTAEPGELTGVDSAR